MPEGDTLHRLARTLGAALTGASVRALVLPRLAHPTEAFVGTRIEGIEALGKHLVMRFSNGRALVTHLGMHGRWRLGAASAPPGGPGVVVARVRTDAHEAVATNAPSVRLLDQRRLRADPRLRALGPDVLGDAFDADDAARRLRALHPLPIGPALLEQRAVAGLGNVWKSELLYLEGISPRTPVGDVEPARLAALLARGRDRMQRNVARGGRRTTREDARPGESPLHVYGRAGRPCPRCGTAVESFPQGEPSRITYRCPRCQPDPPGR